LKKYILYTLLVLGLSCSDDGEVVTNEPEEEALLLSDFSIVSFDDDAFYEYRFDGSTQQAVTFNLTAQQGISRQVFLVHRNEAVFGFYNQGNAFIKDFSSNQLFFVDDFGGDPSEERITARNDRETLGIIYTFLNSNEFFLRVIDVQNSNRFNISLGELSFNLKLYIQGDKLYVVHNQGIDTQLLEIDKNTQSIVAQLDYGEDVSGIGFGDNEDLFVFNFSGDFSQRDSGDLSLISEGSSSFIPSDNFTYKYRNGVIYSQFQYPQPNFYAIGPNAYNLASQEEQVVDVASIFNTYVSNEESTESVQPVHFDYDITNELWIVTFVAQNTNEQERYGYFVINKDGEIIDEVSLDRLPWTVMVYN